MNYNAEILEGIWYLIIAILRTSFPYILIMLGFSLYIGETPIQAKNTGLSPADQAHNLQDFKLLQGTGQKPAKRTRKCPKNWTPGYWSRVLARISAPF